MRLDYIPVYSMEQMLETLDRELEIGDGHMFVETVVFSKNRAVVMTGNMTDCCPPRLLNEIGQNNKPWFFKHVESFIDSGPATEYIPLMDYYHRHSK